MAGMMVATAVAVVAAVKLDLDRLDPVPEGQQIPIQDFFRPAYFSNPELNFCRHACGGVGFGRTR